MRNRGFIQLSLMGWMAVGASVIILGLSVSLKIQSSRLASVKQEYATFQAQVKAAGDIAKEKARVINEENNKRKVKSDEELRKLRIANAALDKRLRDNAGRGSMSGNEAATRIAENACVNGKAINDAVSRFTERLEGFTGRAAELAIKGQSAIDELNNAKRWAQER